jgi:uncharacterized membrane protein YukC
MQENLKDILTNLSTEVDQETLLLYLQGKLSAEQQHEVEKKMMDNEFASDALEGLQNFKDEQRLQLLVDQLKKDLRKKKLSLDPWVTIAIILVLVLVVIGYFIIRRYTSS